MGAAATVIVKVGRVADSEPSLTEITMLRYTPVWLRSGVPDRELSDEETQAMAAAMQARGAA